MRPPFPRNDPGKAPGRAPPEAPPVFRRRFSDPPPLSPPPRNRSTRSPFLLPPVGRSGSRPAGRPRTRDIGPFPDDLLPLQLLPFLPRQSEEAPEHLLVVVPHRLRGPLDPSGAFGKLRDGPELVDPAVQGIVKLPSGPALAQVGVVVLVPAALNGGGGEPRLLAGADDLGARAGGGKGCHGLRGRRRHPQGFREGGTLRVVPCGDGDESVRAAVDPRRGKRHVPVSRPLPVPSRDVGVQPRPVQRADQGLRPRTVDQLPLPRPARHTPARVFSPCAAGSRSPTGPSSRREDFPPPRPTSPRSG